MKNILYALLIITTLLSFKSNTKQINNDTTAIASRIDSSQALIKKIIPIIQGVWIDADYIGNLIRTKSPYLCSKLGGVDLISIPISEHVHASITATTSNGHEPDNFKIFFKVGQKPTSLKISLKDGQVSSNFFELGYDIKQNDTSLIIYHYDKTNNLLSKAKYIKVLESNMDNDDAAYGIDFITNKILISGKYVGTNSTGQAFTAAFNNNGKISGFQSFKTFYINTDFEAAPENSVDEIDFDINSKTQKGYAYKFNADTLNLYKTKMDADSTLFIKERPIYKLVKIK